MAFKFKLKKRPTVTQAFGAGLAQGTVQGLKEGAARSLQDRLNQQEVFKDFRKNFSQSINYIDVSDDDRKILRDAQSMMLLGTLKSKDDVVTHLNAKSPYLGFKITGASEPKLVGNLRGGYSTLTYKKGRGVVTKLTDPITTINQGITPAEVRKVKLATDKVKDMSSRVKLLEDKKVNASSTGLVEFTEDDQENLDKAKEFLQTARGNLDTLRTGLLTGTAVDTVDDDPLDTVDDDLYKKYRIE